MIERVIYTPEADDDVSESYNWYESREPGLASRIRVGTTGQANISRQKHTGLFMIT